MCRTRLPVAEFRENFVGEFFSAPRTLVPIASPMFIFSLFVLSVLLSTLRPLGSSKPYDFASSAGSFRSSARFTSHRVLPRGTMEFRDARKTSLERRRRESPERTVAGSTTSISSLISRSFMNWLSGCSASHSTPRVPSTRFARPSSNIFTGRGGSSRARMHRCKAVPGLRTSETRRFHLV